MEQVYRAADDDDDRDNKGVRGRRCVGRGGCFCFIHWSLSSVQSTTRRRRRKKSTDAHRSCLFGGPDIQQGSAAVSLPPFALWDERMTTQEAREALAATGRMRGWSSCPSLLSCVCCLGGGGGQGTWLRTHADASSIPSSFDCLLPTVVSRAQGRGGGRRRRTRWPPPSSCKGSSTRTCTCT